MFPFPLLRTPTEFFPHSFISSAVSSTWPTSCFLPAEQHQHNIWKPSPFLSLLPVPCVLIAPQERIGSDEAIWIWVCFSVCMQDRGNTFKQNYAAFLSTGNWQTGKCPCYLIRGLTHFLLKAVQKLQMIWLKKALISPLASREGLWKSHHIVNSSLYGDIKWWKWDKI